MKLLLLLCVCLTVGAAVQYAQEGASSSPVLSYNIPGNMVTTEGTNPVVMYLFMRVVCDSRHQYRVQGFGFATSISHDYTSWEGGIFSMPPDAVEWAPLLQLRETFSGKTTHLKLSPHGAFTEVSKEGDPRLVMPYGFTGSFETTAHALELHVDNWDRFVYLPVSSDAKLDTPSNTFTVVLPPLHGMSEESAAIIIAVNANYHAKLGLSLIVYVAVPYAQAYAANHCISQLIATKQLTLVVWDDVPESAAHTYGHKPLCYSHAILSRWGSQDMLLMIDADEFLAVPTASGSTLQHIHSCIGSSTEATVSRCDTVMNSTRQEPDRLYWKMSRTCSIDFLKAYGAVSAYHIIEAGKTFVNSSAALAFAVHTGHVIAGNSDIVDFDCLRVIHIVNLMKHRIGLDESMQQFDEWKWVL